MSESYKIAGCLWRHALSGLDALEDLALAAYREGNHWRHALSGLDALEDLALAAYGQENHKHVVGLAQSLRNDLVSMWEIIYMGKDTSNRHESGMKVLAGWLNLCAACPGKCASCALEGKGLPRLCENRLGEDEICEAALAQASLPD